MPLFGKKTTTEKDPVCGMSVDPSKASWTSEHGGSSYYFCARGCKDAFDANPGAYLAPRNPSAHH
jgi:P-type Cu+ transporter